MPSTTSSPESSAARARLFLGIPVRLDAYEAIRKHLSPLLRGRWVDDSQLHLTLAFLGERFTPCEVLQRLERCDMFFEASIVSNLGYFRRNHILYASTEHPSLQKLTSDIQQSLELPVVTLTPHITLMRVKAVHDYSRFNAERALFEGHRLGMLERRIVLYESTLHPTGARYKALQVWPV
jgi:2'-5' RNA ligase